MVSKTVIVGVLIGVIAATGLITYGVKFSEENNIKQEYEAWKLKNEKNYGSEEDSTRYLNFRTNWYRAQTHNKDYESGKSTFKLGMTSLADLTDAEFKTRLGLVKKSEQKINEYIPKLDDSNLATSVNWVTAGAVTPVKNQGSCGSCWAFSTTGSMEGLNFIKNKKLQSFSEQQLVDCSTSYGNEGCNGGLMDDAFKYSEKYGLELESSYPYQGSDDSCTYSQSKEVFTNAGFKDVTPKSNSQFKAAIMQQPVSIAIEADSFFFQLYFGGVFTYSGCGTNLDHGVLAVGYGSEKNWLGTEHNYFLVKNSWGSSWGESGYIKILDNGDGSGICGIQLQASYPTA